ncbi:16400_t:CDS:2, partial [Dentiscutata erythropus]
MSEVNGWALYYILTKETWWLGSIFMFPEHKYILTIFVLLYSNTLAEHCILNISLPVKAKLLRMYNLAKEGKGAEEFYDTMSKVNKAIKNISN